MTHDIEHEELGREKRSFCQKLPLKIENQYDASARNDAIYDNYTYVFLFGSFQRARRESRRTTIRLGLRGLRARLVPPGERRSHNSCMKRKWLHLHVTEDYRFGTAYDITLDRKRRPKYCAKKRQTY